MTKYAIKYKVGTWRKKKIKGKKSERGLFLLYGTVNKTYFYRVKVIYNLQGLLQK